MKKTFSAAAFAMVCLLGFTQCGQDTEHKTTTTTQTEEPKYEPPKRVDVTYSIASRKDSAAKLDRYDSSQQKIIMALNRMDGDHLKKADSILLPGQFVDEQQYSPFPFYVPELKDIHKIIFFSYPAQAFGAYEGGKLVKWGPTNMGREKDQTPTGLYYANWKAEETRSTFDDEWLLKWNFNIENKEGIGWHQYAMPGYPASHSCLRLLEHDAKYLYEWADQWVLKGTDNVLAKGTPVIVFGSYPFGSAKPWMALASDPHALDVSEQQVNELVSQYKQGILAEQEKQHTQKQ